MCLVVPDLHLLLVTKWKDAIDQGRPKLVLDKVQHVISFSELCATDVDGALLRFFEDHQRKRKLKVIVNECLCKSSICGT